MSRSADVTYSPGPIEAHRLTPEERHQLARVEALGDAAVDLEDIPEVAFAKPMTAAEAEAFRRKRRSAAE